MELNLCDGDYLRISDGDAEGNILYVSDYQ